MQIQRTRVLNETNMINVRFAERTNCSRIHIPHAHEFCKTNHGTLKQNHGRDTPENEHEQITVCETNPGSY